jgi:hypothetical protein
MTRKLGWMMVVLALSVSGFAGDRPGSIGGSVKSASGVPQMGAVVEVFAVAASRALIVFTDAHGSYTARGLAPGVYQVKVTAPSFLPSLRENVAVNTGTHVIVNLTLSTLSEAVQMLPARRTSPQEDDDWRWTLRSVANRPVLRVLDDGPLVVAAESGAPRTLKARVAFVAGSGNEGFGGSADMSTQFRVEQSLFSAGTLSFNGNVGYGSGTPAGVVRAAYSHQFSNGSHPQFALTLRHFATADTAQHNAALDALAFSVADTMTLADFLELNYGGEAQTIQFHERVSAFRPFGSVAVHLSPNTVVQYRYATSEPNTRMEKGFDTAPADLSESGPRMSLVKSVPALERAHHHEISVSRHVGRNSIQVAAYSDRIHNAALVGVGDVNPDSGAFLPDIYSGSFTYNGSDLSTRGVRAVFQRSLTSDLAATLVYAYGGVVALDRLGIPWQDVQSSLRTEERQSVTAKVAGTVPRCHTHWIASYKWTSGRALTPVDLFNASPGQADPFLNIFIRQPLPATSFLPGKLEALVDLRNLMAQGYVPVIGQDGQVVYLVQSARSVRGGVAFTF